MFPGKKIQIFFRPFFSFSVSLSISLSGSDFGVISIPRKGQQFGSWREGITINKGATASKDNLLLRTTR